MSNDKGAATGFYIYPHPEMTLHPALASIRRDALEHGYEIRLAEGNELIVAERVRMGLAGLVVLIILAVLTAGLALLALLFMRPSTRIVRYTVGKGGSVKRTIVKRVA